MFGLTPFERKSYDLFDVFNNFDKNFFGANHSLNACKTDIRDEGDKYVLDAELPGFDREDIKLDIDGNLLILFAEHSTKSEDNSKDGKYIRRERSYGSYKRSFDISDIDVEKIDAEYKNGVLTIQLPKLPANSPQTKRLEIK